MLAAEGRTETTARTLAALSGDCGARKTLHWVGESAPPLHDGWDLAYWPGKPSGQLADFWRALTMTAREAPGADIVCVEDDVIPCRNALAKVVAWHSPYLTTFVNTRRFQPGLRLVDNGGFWPLCCVKIPAPVVERLIAENPAARGWQDKRPSIHEGDMVIGRMLRVWGLKYYQHTSLFQHVGVTSLCNPHATLAGHRTAHDFPGTDFDALTL
jgi:hypothetical protein